MTGIWAFLLQTLYVSLVGGLLLLVKEIFRDKLSPRWQYGVWTVLALRIVIPAETVGQYVLLPLPLWVETLRILAEDTILSGWIPLLSGLYLAGAAVFLLRYLITYLRLNRLLRRGEEAPDLDRLTARIAADYGLRPCRSVILPGLPSPMVCGVFRPILAVPQGRLPPDHVILHELLHVARHDALQNVFWSICRAVHWCNPFVHYLLDRIGNDMESLCDQRVLERLEGEARRDYGLSLLAMSNDRYPRAPGTTSISNGGKNIARRIEAIVRFKKYPAGMALASVCVTIMLASVCLFSASAQGLAGAEEGDGPWKTARAEASIRLARCTTAAGAIDTYAKGLLEGRGDYLSLASASAEAPDFTRQVQIFDYSYDQDDRYFNTGKTTEVSLPACGERYAIHNLRTLSDGTQAAQLIFLLGEIPDDPVLLAIEETGNVITGALQMEVRLTEGESWTVGEIGPCRLYLAEAAKSNATGLWLSDKPFAPARLYQGEGESGTVTKETLTEHYIETGRDPLGLSGTQGLYDPLPDPNARFTYVQEVSTITYTFQGTEEERTALTEVILQVSNMERTQRKPRFSDHFPFDEGSWGSEFGGHRGSYVKESVGMGWDGVIELRHYAGFDYEDYPDHGGAVQIRWNGDVVDEMILEEVIGDA